MGNKLEKDKLERMGMSKIMRCCEKEATIIEYNSAIDIVVMFKETGELKNTTYGCFKNGSIKSHFSPTVYEVGIVGLEKTKNGNDVFYNSYTIWHGMIERCYSKKYKDKHLTYKNVTCCDEWLCYKNFKEWYNDNHYEVEGQRMALDKDILVKGNKIYSPETCVFVPQRINVLFTKCNRTRGIYPIGVNYFKIENKYRAQCNCDKKGNITIGLFNNTDDAFYKGYKPFKEKYIKEIADEYKDKIPNKLFNAMYNWKVEITD
jgi:hypothetical protein